MLRRSQSLSNCLFFAIALWRRRKRKNKKGGLVVRGSVWGKFPHFLYVWYNPHVKKLRIVSYVPTNPKHKLLPPPLFKGRVRWGDIVLGERLDDANTV